MQDEQSQKVILRFFTVIDKLIELKRLRGINTFCTRYEINRRNFLTLRSQPERDMFKLSWLTALVYDYDVNPDYLITGRGRMFSKNFKQEK